MYRKRFAFLVCLLFLYTVFPSFVFASPEENSSAYHEENQTEAPPSINEFWTEEMAATLSLACEWVKNSDQGNLYFLCMGSAGKTAVSASVNQYITEVSLKKSYENPISASYDALNVTFCGYDAHNVLGRDLIQIIANISNYQEQDLYTVAYALLAIDSNQYQVDLDTTKSTDADENESKNNVSEEQILKDAPLYHSIKDYVKIGEAAALKPAIEARISAFSEIDSENSTELSGVRQKLVETLLSFQNEDGGFQVSPTTHSSSVIQTGLALTALAPYRDEPNVASVIEQGLLFLEQEQQNDGTFYQNGLPTSIAVSKVIVTLYALDIPLDNPQFMKNGETLLDVLLRYVQVDGGFSSTMDEPSDITATENAILALAAVKKGHSPYMLDARLVANTDTATENITVTVETIPSQISVFQISLLALLGIVLLTITAVWLIGRKRKKVPDGKPVSVASDSTNDSSADSENFASSINRASS